MSENMNVYTCDQSIKEVLFQDDFVETVKMIEKRFYSYDYFIQDLERFFNDQIEDGDLEKFKGEIFELCDSGIGVQFPFCVKDNKLKFVETDAWRSIILSSLALNKANDATNKLKRKNTEFEETHEQSISTQL